MIETASPCATLMWILRTDSTDFAASSTADCDIRPGPGDQWTVTVTHAGSVLVTETCLSAPDAAMRVDTLRETFIQQGWTDLPPRDHRWRPSNRLA